MVGETIKLVIPFNVAKNLLVDLKNGRNVVVKHEAPDSSSSSQGNSGGTNIEMKALCASYREAIEYKIMEDIYQYSLIGQTVYCMLDEIFYSPTKDSCLYSRISHLYDKNNKKLNFISYDIYDYLQNKNIFNRFWPPLYGNLTTNSVPNKAAEEYRAEIKRLMGN